MTVLAKAGRRADLQLGALLLLATLAWRASTFGDTNLHVDDSFYFLVGQRMHQGLLPYVDVWDRKPFGLFFLYYLIAGVSTSVVAYQLAASLSVAATALVIARMVRALAPAGTLARQGALLAGLVYVMMLGPLEGFGGQAPVFYNLLMALAGWLLLRAGAELARGRAGLGVYAAMALCGLAIWMKQTCLFEAGWFGLWVLARLRAGGLGWGGLARRAGVFMALGAGPLLATGLAYAALGHGGEWWHAMVLANLAKAHEPAARTAGLALALGLRIAPLMGVALWGLVGPRRPDAGLLVGWVAAAGLGFAAVPNCYAHYALPWLVPLCVAAGLVMAREGLGRVTGAALGVWAIVWYTPPARAWTRHSIAAMDTLAAAVRAHDQGGGLLVFDGPPYLYALTGERFLSPLVFPHHLNHAIERNVSHLPTDAEIDRILAARPGVVVMAPAPRNLPANAYGWQKVSAYVHRQCRQVARVAVYEEGGVAMIDVWGDCPPGAAPAAHRG